MKRNDSILLKFYTDNLPKYQTRGQVKVKDSRGAVTSYDVNSPAYKKLYEQGIGSWQALDPISGRWKQSDASNPNAEFVSSTKTLPEVVVTGKIKKNSLGDYSNAFYKQNPFETFYNNRYGELKRDFTSQPGWAQRSVGGWDRESRQKNIREQIQQEYQTKFNEYVSQKLLNRTPQNNQSRNQWLSNKNFSNRELDILTRGAGSKLPQPNLYAQGAQGLYNTADMLSFGKLPELAMPGVAKSEVANYNNPLLTLAPLSVPAKMVQSAYKDNYSFGDALAGKPNDAGIVEDIITDPLTWATFGTKGAINTLGKTSKFLKPYASKLDDITTKFAGFKLNPSSQKGTMIENIDPETGASFFSYKDYPTFKEKFVNPVINPIKDKISSFNKPKFNTGPDYNTPFKKLSDYDNWARSISPDLMATKRTTLRDAHAEAIEYFKSKGVDKPTPRDLAFRIKQKLASTLPSYTNPVYTKDGKRFVYGKEYAHPDVYKNIRGVYSDQENKFINHFTNLLDDLKPELRNAEAVALDKWNYDISKLSPEEVEAMLSYARGYDELLNTSFRRSTPQTDAIDNVYRDYGKVLTQGILKNKFPEAAGVRRGVQNYSVQLLDPKTFKPTGVTKTRAELSVGDVYKDDGFLSTSINPEHNWGVDQFSEWIDIPGGSKQSYGFPNAASATPYVNEAEAILPPGLIRRIEEVREANATTGKFPNNARYRTSILNPYNLALPLIGGAAAARSQKKAGGPIVDSRGQWAHPGKRTIVPTPDGRITMKKVPYPVYGQDETGFGQMMYPEQEYQFPGQIVDEIPMMQPGGMAPETQQAAEQGRQWLQNWYQQRMQLPQFKEVASQRANLLSQMPDVEYNPEAVRKDGSMAYYDSRRSKIVAGDNAVNNSPLLWGHELNHYAKEKAPQPRDLNWGKEYTKRALPFKQASKQFGMKGSRYGYMRDPFESEAFLTMFRQQAGIDPTKQYTVEEMGQLMQPYINAPRMSEQELQQSGNDFTRDRLKTFFQTLGNDPENLLFLHNSTVKNTGAEIPMAKSGGQHGGLDRWFAEKWVDVKTGKPCGRQEGEKRGYPACRPSRRVSSQTPKTSSEMSPAEKAKFKRTKTSSERIPYNHKRAQFGLETSQQDSVRNIAGNILKYEQLQGGPGGAPLPQYADPKYMQMLMQGIYPEIKKILPNASAMELGEAMDFVFNAGWDNSSNKITKDPRAYALQEYYRQYDPSKLDAEGKWSGRKNPAYSFDQEYASTIGKLPENQRRVFMNRGRDWYYKNINNPAPGVPNSNYYDTWYGRIWNTNEYAPFNPKNPKFKYKK